MTLPVTFATLAAGNQNLALIDTQFAAIGALSVIPCTATGQNAVVLTPNANTPIITGYTDLTPVFAWKQAQTSSGAVTIQVIGQPALNAYKNNGQTAMGSGDLQAGFAYQAVALASLNGGAGGFVVNVVPTALVAAGPVQATFKNLVVTNTTATTAATQVQITADAITLYDGTAVYTTAISVNVTADITVAGVNGLDTGAAANNTWYFIWIIQNTISGAIASLLSLSATAPTMPAGYVRNARVGAIRRGTAQFINMMQKGRRQQYLVGTFNANALAILPSMSTGVQGTYSGTSPTLAAQSISVFAPSTASAIVILATNHLAAGAQGGVIVAPNNSYGGTNNGPAGSNNMVWPIDLCNATGALADYQSAQATLVLESTNIYWASAAAGGAITCLGYEDNI